MIRRNTKRQNLFCHNNIVIKGITGSSIIEKPVKLFFNHSDYFFNAIEFYETSSEKTCPLMAVDLICNAYLRLSYLKPSLTSATLGSSVAGAISFRTSDNILHFIPEISSATLQFDHYGQPQVILEGAYENLAKIKIQRTYGFQTQSRPLICSTKISFTALQKFELSSSFQGSDAFRFCTISSMFTPDLYDGNILQFYSSASSCSELRFSSETKRGQYLFSKTPALYESFTLWKDFNSAGRKGTPGAKDSPSIEISTPNKELKLGVQGYLAETMDINHDSLSVWMEWLNAPKRFNCGDRIDIIYTTRALSPKIQKTMSQMKKQQRQDKDL